MPSPQRRRRASWPDNAAGKKQRAWTTSFPCSHFPIHLPSRGLLPSVITLKLRKKRRTRGGGGALLRGVVSHADCRRRRGHGCFLSLQSKRLCSTGPSSRASSGDGKRRVISASVRVRRPIVRRTEPRSRWTAASPEESLSAPRRCEASLPGRCRSMSRFTSAQRFPPTRDDDPSARVAVRVEGNRVTCVPHNAYYLELQTSLYFKASKCKRINIGLKKKYVIRFEQKRSLRLCCNVTMDCTPVKII